MTKDSTRLARREDIIVRWEKHSAIPLAVMALTFLALWATQVLADLNQLEWEIIEALILVIWALFVIDFSVRFWLHQDKLKFLRSNIIELLALLVPAFRSFRMLRVLTALGIFTRVVQSLQARVNLYIALILPMMIFAGSLGVFEAERNAQGASILNFPDAVWWSIVTAFTVGYGDLTPVTVEGRVIAVMLMLGGFGLISVVTANLASYFLRSNLHEKSNRTE
ncbi:MAG: potassium channel family protein [Micrococcales bacterium]